MRPLLSLGLFLFFLSGCALFKLPGQIVETTGKVVETGGRVVEASGKAVVAVAQTTGKVIEAGHDVATTRVVQEAGVIP